VSTVAGSVSFASNGYQINPGLADRNLALSKEAQKYDQYRFRKLRFRFVRSRAVTTTPGMIGMALDPNPNTSDPAALARFNAYEIRTMESVYAPMELNIPQEALSGWRFVRCGPNGSDRSLYDIGRLIVATQDEDDTSKVGFIEIHYEVEFKHYHLEPTAPMPNALAILNLSSTQNITTATPTTITLDEEIVDGIGVTNASGVLTLPCGQYKVTGQVCSYDTSSEAFDQTFELLKDGSSLSPPVQANAYNASGRGSQSSLTGWLYSDGTTTVSLQATLVGTAGTLQIAGDRTRIVIESLS